jgi:hypothetical protein
MEALRRSVIAEREPHIEPSLMPSGFDRVECMRRCGMRLDGKISKHL